MNIRDETAADIRTVTKAAFAGEPYSRDIIYGLRVVSTVLLSLVVAGGHAVLGNVAFRPVTIGDTKEGSHGDVEALHVLRVCLTVVYRPNGRTC